MKLFNNPELKFLWGGTSTEIKTATIRSRSHGLDLGGFNATLPFPVTEFQATLVDIPNLGDHRHRHNPVLSSSVVLGSF
jgi:hypothetical protein